MISGFRVFTKVRGDRASISSSVKCRESYLTLAFLRVDGKTKQHNKVKTLGETQRPMATAAKLY